MTDIKIILRDALESLDALKNTTDAETESEPGEVQALLAGLAELVARHAHAANVRAVHAKTPFGARLRSIDPVLSAPGGNAWMCLNLTASTYQAAHEGASHEVPPGPSYLEFDPTDALAAPIARSEIEVYGPGAHDAAGNWQDSAEIGRS